MNPKRIAESTAAACFALWGMGGNLPAMFPITAPTRPTPPTPKSVQDSLIAAAQDKRARRAAKRIKLA